MTEHYLERINKVLHYVDQNLDGDLSLATIAEVGCYSPFHLHRLFKAITGETLNAYITRKRIEKIASYLMHRRELTISELSTQFGFNSNSSLTRTFTKFYGMSPSQFRNLLPGEYSKICQVDRKNGKDIPVFEQYICNIKECLNYMLMHAKIEIKEMPKVDLAYVTQIGEEGLDGAFERMFVWAQKQKLVQRPDFRFFRVYHDSFKITQPVKVRMSIGVPVDASVSTSGEIGLTSLERSNHVVARFEIEPRDFGKSWEGFFVWMNENGYKKSERDPYEILYNDFRSHPEGKCVVDFCVPIH